MQGTLDFKYPFRNHRRRPNRPLGRCVHNAFLTIYSEEYISLFKNKIFDYLTFRTIEITELKYTHQST